MIPYPYHQTIDLYNVYHFYWKQLKKLFLIKLMPLSTVKIYVQLRVLLSQKLFHWLLIRLTWHSAKNCMLLSFLNIQWTGFNLILQIDQVPPRSILGCLLFLMYINNMPQAVKCDLFIYADDSCLVSQY